MRSWNPITILQRGTVLPCWRLAIIGFASAQLACACALGRPTDKTPELLLQVRQHPTSSELATQAESFYIAARDQIAQHEENLAAGLGVLVEPSVDSFPDSLHRGCALSGRARQF